MNTSKKQFVAPALRGETSLAKLTLGGACTSNPRCDV